MELFRYSTCPDKVFAGFGFAASVGFGAGMPAMCLLFGALSDNMGGAKDAAGFSTL